MTNQSYTSFNRGKKEKKKKTDKLHNQNICIHEAAFNKPPFLLLHVPPSGELFPPE